MAIHFEFNDCLTQIVWRIKSLTVYKECHGMFNVGSHFFTCIVSNIWDLRVGWTISIRPWKKDISQLLTHVWCILLFHFYHCFLWDSMWWLKALTMLNISRFLTKLRSQRECQICWSDQFTFFVFSEGLDATKIQQVFNQLHQYVLFLYQSM